MSIEAASFRQRLPAKTAPQTGGCRVAENLTEVARAWRQSQADAGRTVRGCPEPWGGYAGRCAAVRFAAYSEIRNAPNTGRPGGCEPRIPAQATLSGLSSTPDGTSSPHSPLIGGLR